MHIIKVFTGSYIGLSSRQK